MSKIISRLVFIYLLILLFGCNNENINNKRNYNELGVEPQRKIDIPQKQNIKIQQENGSVLFNIIDNNQQTAEMTDDQLKGYLYDKYQVPKQWGEFLPGIKTQLDTPEKVIALTLDACGGSNGNQYDASLIYFLKAAKRTCNTLY